MATVNLLPNADVSNFPAWTISSGSNVWAMLDDDDSSHVGADSSDIEATAAGKICIVDIETFPSSTATINSVTLVFKHNSRDRGITYNISTAILSPSAPYYVENLGTTYSGASWLTSTMTTHTTYDGSHPWDRTLLEDLRLGFNLIAITGGTVGITYAYLSVDYTETAVADNAIFFGSNF